MEEKNKGINDGIDEEEKRLREQVSKLQAENQSLQLGRKSPNMTWGSNFYIPSPILDPPLDLLKVYILNTYMLGLWFQPRRLTFQVGTPGLTNCVRANRYKILVYGRKFETQNDNIKSKEAIF